MSRLFMICALVAVMHSMVNTISAQTNYLDVMTYMSGEFGGSEFGESIASLDFNGDGYMDLVVSSGAWNPTLTFADQNRWGKLYFYWGGPGFDNIPDFVIPGAYNWQMGPGAGVINAGDMNGDGIEDLILVQRSSSYNRLVTLYYGRLNPQSEPDVVLTYEYPYYSCGDIISLGDINGDNRDDVCLMTGENSGATRVIQIWKDVTEQPIPFISTMNEQRLTRLCGIGDVNNDGFDDTLLHIPNNPLGETHNRLVLYYGSQTFPETDSLVICDDSNSIIKSWSCPLGDVNGDGYDDFTAGSLIYDYSQHLWLGSDSLSADWSLDLSGDWHSLTHQISERGAGYPMVHGDLNGDGYQDVLGFHSEAGYFSGYLYLWMGGQSMNGYMDYLRLGMDGYDCMNYGWSKVTGDFNADGYCDVAVGAPWWDDGSMHYESGRVYILAGNADLHDTTVESADDLLPVPIVDNWQIEVYPNPSASHRQRLNIAFKGIGYKEAGNYALDMYNIKGQKLLSQTIPMDSLQDGCLILELDSLPKGVLLVSISKDGFPVTTKKLTNY